MDQSWFIQEIRHFLELLRHLLQFAVIFIANELYEAFIDLCPLNLWLLLNAILNYIHLKWWFFYNNFIIKIFNKIINSKLEFDDLINKI